MADTPVANKNDIIEIEVTINKKSPATPGDKTVSRIIKIKPGVLPVDIRPGDIIPVLQTPKARRYESLVVNDFSKGDEKTIKEDFSTKWKGTENATISRPHIGDLVIGADLLDKPKWQVKVKVCYDGVLESREEYLTPLSPEPPPSVPTVPPKGSNPPLTPPGPANPAVIKEEYTIPIRVNALLSFDTGIINFNSYDRWTGLNRTTKEKRKQEILQAINDEDETKLHHFILNRYITTSRLRLDEIHEGEWLLPVFIKNMSNKKVLLTYINVIIKWISDDAKTADKTAKPDAKTPDKTAPVAKTA